MTVNRKLCHPKTGWMEGSCASVDLPIEDDAWEGMDGVVAFTW